MSGNGDDYRALLLAIYRAHAPEKIHQVDALLKKYKGREEAVIAAAAHKYGATLERTPSDGGSPPAAVSPPAPSKLDASGNGESTNFTISEPSSPQRAATARGTPHAVGDGSHCQSYHDRLIRIYEAYAKRRVPFAARDLSKYPGREEDVIRAAVKKYGPEPPSPPPTSHSSPSGHAGVAAPNHEERLAEEGGPDAPPSPSKKEQDFRARVIALYEQYAPQRLPRVDHEMSKYKGREAALIRAIEAKYAPTAVTKASSSTAPSRHAQRESGTPAAGPVATAVGVPQPPAPDISSERASPPVDVAAEARARVVALYIEHAPLRLLHVYDDMCAYRGQETALIHALEAEFQGGASATPAPQPHPILTAQWSSHPAEVAPAEVAELVPFTLDNEFAPPLAPQVAAAMAQSEAPQEDRCSAPRSAVSSAVASQTPQIRWFVCQSSEDEEEQAHWGEETTGKGDERAVPDLWLAAANVNVSAAPEVSGGVGVVVSPGKETDARDEHAVSEHEVQASMDGAAERPVEALVNGVGTTPAVFISTPPCAPTPPAVSTALGAPRQERTHSTPNDTAAGMAVAWSCPADTVTGPGNPTTSAVLPSSENGMNTSGSAEAYHAEFTIPAAIVHDVFTSLGSTRVADVETVNRPTCELLLRQAFGIALHNGDHGGDDSELEGTNDARQKFLSMDVVTEQQFTAFLYAYGTSRYWTNRDVAYHVRRCEAYLKRCQNALVSPSHTVAAVTPPDYRMSPGRVITAEQQQSSLERGLRSGFWLYRCVFPCVRPTWKRCWAFLSTVTANSSAPTGGASRCVFSRISICYYGGTKVDLMVPFDKVVACNLSAVTGNDGPDLPAQYSRNGVLFQLSDDPSAVRIWMCCEEMRHSQGIVKAFQGWNKYNAQGASAAVPEPSPGGVDSTPLVVGTPSSAPPITADAMLRQLAWTRVWVCRCAGRRGMSDRSHGIESSTSPQLYAWAFYNGALLHTKLSRRRSEESPAADRVRSWDVGADLTDVTPCRELPVRPPRSRGVPEKHYPFIIDCVGGVGRMYAWAATPLARSAVVGQLRRLALRHKLVSELGEREDDVHVARPLEYSPGVPAWEGR